MLTGARTERTLYLVIFLLSSTLFAILFCVTYIHIEIPAYVWDYGGYWSIFQRYGALISSGNPAWLQTLRSEIANSDYNPAATIPLMPAYVLFGGGRIAYVAATAIIYLLPTLFCAAALSGVFARSNRRLLFCLTLALLYTPFWAPTLRGMIDIVGLIPLGLAALLLLRTKFLVKGNWKHAIALGILLWCPFLLRRWYLFSVVALLIVSGAFALVDVGRGQDRVRALIGVGLTYAGAGAIALFCAIVFQGPLLKTIVETSYVGIYSAYQSDFKTLLFSYLDRFGLVLLLLSLVGNVMALRVRDWRVIYCTLVSAVAFLLFSRIQAPGVHHSLPVAFFLFPAFHKGASWVAESIPGRAGWVAVLFVSMLNFGSTFIPGDWGSQGLSGNLFPSERIYPLHIENYSEYARLIKDLSKLPEGSKFVVFASSVNLSDSLLAALEPALLPKVAWASQVDLKDHFDLLTLQADYAVIATPTPTDLPRTFQRVVTLPAKMIRTGQGIGQAYTPLDAEYHIARRGVARIYRRTRPLTFDETEELLHEFEAFYPQWQDYYDKSLTLAMAGANVQLGDVWGRVVQESSDTLFLHPGANLPTSLELRFGGRSTPKSLGLEIPEDMARSCPDADGVAVKIDNQSGPVYAGEVLPGQARVVQLPRSDRFRIVVSPRQNPSCDHLNVHFDW